MRKAMVLAAVWMMVAAASGSGFARAEGGEASGTPLISSEPKGFVLAGAKKDKAEAKVVEVAGPGGAFTKAWHVEVKEKVAGDYSIQLVQKLKAPPKKGDVVFLTAWARRISSQDESGEGRVVFVLEQVKGKNEKAFTASFGLGKEWQKFEVPAVVAQDFSDTGEGGGAQVAVRLAAYAQVVEVADVELVTMPAGTDVKSLPRTKITYAGREDGAAWRLEAEKRIEEIRKAPLTVTVVDGAGKPVGGATVEVHMKKHAFPFGSCYAPKMILGGEGVSEKDAETYRAKFAELFNYGTDEWEMKWPQWGDAAVRRNAMACVDWMDAHGIQVRGHTMVWPGWKRLPESVKALAGKPEELSAAIHEHIENVGSTFKGRVVDWDVVNEPFVNNDLLKILGEDAMAQWFTWAREAAGPGVKLYLNETSVPTSPPGDERYAKLYAQAKMIKEKTGGKAIDGVGFQSHFGMNVQPPVKLLGIYDDFAKLGLPVRITELDVDSNDEDLQAAYWRDFLTASFSHPNINGVMIWGFWEGAHWKPNAAMFRKDWSERPIAGIWKELVFKKWWTDAGGQTDAAGQYQVRGFLGDYEVVVKGAGGQAATMKTSLTKDSGQVRIVLQ